MIGRYRIAGPRSARYAANSKKFGPNFGPLTPKHHRKSRSTRDQRARRINKIENPTKSAKPPSPVQIRAAPPILSHTKITTCRIGWLGAIRQFGNSWEQFAFERFDRLAMRGVD